MARGTGTARKSRRKTGSSRVGLGRAVCTYAQRIHRSENRVVYGLRSQPRFVPRYKTPTSLIFSLFSSLPFPIPALRARAQDDVPVLSFPVANIYIFLNAKNDR